MDRRWLSLVALVPVCAAMAMGQNPCIATPAPPKLPVTRASGFNFSGKPLKVVLLADMADTWKSTRREVGVVPVGTLVEVLEDIIVVEAPDVVWVSRPIDEMKLKEGDTILRYARLSEASADLWAEGCWYKQAHADFIVEPNGAGCGGADCAAKVTKLGRQMWWFHIRLPNGKTGWTLSQCLDLPTAD